MIKSNFAISTTLEERLVELGGVARDRVRAEPAPGTATLNDLLQINECSELALYELIDGCLVEKAMGYEASIVAMAIVRIIGTYVSQNRSGLVSGPDGFFKLLASVRGPDVAYVAVDRLPNGRLPNEPFPAIAPNLVVEVLSPGNTKAEMARKRLEYFLHGIQVVWMVDCTQRTVAVYSSPTQVYSSPTQVQVFGETDLIDGGTALPGFTAPVAEFFRDLDIGKDV